MNSPNYEDAPEVYEAIEEMAYHGFSTTEICEVLQLDITTYEGNASCLLAHRKGFLKSQLELRQRIFKDAKAGSSPAQTLASKILDAAEYKMNAR